MRIITCKIAPIIAALVLGGLTATVAGAGNHYGELLLGYNGGPGFHLTFTWADFLDDLPLRARFGLGYTSQAAGQSEGARRIFINDATNGTPEKAGRSWNYRFDVALPLRGGDGGGLLLYGGPRYSRFAANFKYVGGNEDFDITSHQWGFGGGLESAREVGMRTAVVVRGGIDYFFLSPLYGHDTAYSPDGEHVNPRDDYEWSDADAVIEQPSLVGRFMAGLRYQF